MIFLSCPIIDTAITKAVLLLVKSIIIIIITSQKVRHNSFSLEKQVF